MSKVTRPLLVAAALMPGALVVGWVNLRTDEPQPAAFLLLTFSFLCVLVDHRRFWLWPLLLGLVIPTSYVWASATGFPAKDPPLHLYETLIALIPAFLGGLAGLGVRQLIKPSGKAEARR
jgi:hypothetical protein